MKLRHAIGMLALLIVTASHAETHGTPSLSEKLGWEKPQAPFRIYGNTWYVGSKGLSAILITSKDGHILIDGTLPANAPMIEAHIRALGFRVQDIKLILNSHAHGDHAGAIAALARDSGAQVAASSKGAAALMRGGDDPTDPQYGDLLPYPKVAKVRAVVDRETVHVGSLAVQAHYTPGHTPGSTSWSWTSCADETCHSMVYADSLTLISAGNYRYTDPAHPERLQAYRQSLKTIESLPCDILMAPHPESVDLLQRAGQAKADGGPATLVDPQACKTYAAKARARMETLIQQESAKSPTP